MILTRRDFLAVCTATALTACSRQEYRALPKGSTVLALGDSLTEGYGASAETAYPAVLAELTGWRVINSGVSGNTSADVLSRLPEVLKHAPRLILLGIGGNDFLRHVPENKIRANIRHILDSIRAEGIPVVLIAEPHLTAGALLTGHLSDHPLYEDIAAEVKVPLLSDAWSDILSDKSLKSDQIHANTAGYRLFAEKTVAFLRKNGFLFGTVLKNMRD